MPLVFHVGQRVKCLRTTGYGHEGNEFTTGNFYVVSSWLPGALFVVADDRGRPNGWNDRFFEPAEVDNRQSVVLYTVLWKVAGDDKIWSSGCPTEAFALSEKATLEEDITVEYICMKKITVRI